MPLRPRTSPTLRSTSFLTPAMATGRTLTWCWLGLTCLSSSHRSTGCVLRPVAARACCIGSWRWPLLRPSSSRCRLQRAFSLRVQPSAQQRWQWCSALLWLLACLLIQQEAWTLRSDASLLLFARSVRQCVLTSRLTARAILSRCLGQQDNILHLPQMKHFGQTIWLSL